MVFNYHNQMVSSTTIDMQMCFLAEVFAWHVKNNKGNPTSYIAMNEGPSRAPSSITLWFNCAGAIP